MWQKHWPIKLNYLKNETTKSVVILKKAEQDDMDLLPVLLNLYWIHVGFYQSPFSSLWLLRNLTVVFIFLSPSNLYLIRGSFLITLKLCKIYAIYFIWLHQIIHKINEFVWILSNLILLTNFSPHIKQNSSSWSRFMYSL